MEWNVLAKMVDTVEQEIFTLSLMGSLAPFISKTFYEVFITSQEDARYKHCHNNEMRRP